MHSPLSALARSPSAWNPRRVIAPAPPPSSPGPDDDAPAGNTRLLREEAERAGFHRVGFAPVGPWERHALYRRWLEAGRAGEMDYLATQAEERADPRRVLASA